MATIGLWGALALVTASAGADDLEARYRDCVQYANNGSTSSLDACSRSLVDRDPENAKAHYLRFAAHGSKGRLDEARVSLERAHSLGLPEAPYRSGLDQLEQARPWPVRVAPMAAWGFAVWLVVLASLFVSGLVLSRATMSRATRAAGAAEPRPLEKKLRAAYGAVITACCGFYYVSIPLLVVAVLGIGGSLIYATFAIGRVPIKLVLVVGLLTLVTAWVILKSLFVRGRDVEPGLKLDVGQHPRLRATLEEAAQRVGTRPVDTVYMVPGTTVAVFERGGMRARVRGGAERCLVLGVGVLEGMDLQAFKAVLAHEYGHFKNEDTAGGALALAVRRSMLAMAMGLAENGAAAWYNPAWHFVNQFHRVFLRVSHGATRLQEILADRWAAFAYGSAAFERGLTHVVRRSIHFDVHVQRTISEVIDKQLPLANLYTYAPAPEDGLEKEIADVVEEALARSASEYDSHPPPKDRIAWVRALAVTLEGDAETPAWSLFEDRAAIESSMTDEVCVAVTENHQIVIPRAPTSSDTNATA